MPLAIVFMSVCKVLVAKLNNATFIASSLLTSINGINADKARAVLDLSSSLISNAWDVTTLSRTVVMKTLDSTSTLDSLSA